jgi:hypothetical protein
MEKLVKGQTEKTASDKELNLKFSNLEDALNRALEAVQTLGPRAKQQPVDSSVNGMVSPPPEIAKETIDRIKELVEMGDVMQIKSIAEELTSDSDALAPFCSELIRLAEDFDLDGIQKLILASDS